MVIPGFQIPTYNDNAFPANSREGIIILQKITFQ